MVVVDSVNIPRGRPFTVEDLATMPEDGNRYELIDGTLVVSPAPDARHHKIVAKLVVVLDNACPSDLHVLPAPFAVRPSCTELQPDTLEVSRQFPVRVAPNELLGTLT